MGHEILDRCGNRVITEVLIGYLPQIEMTPEGMKEFNLRLTVLFVFMKEHPFCDIRYAFAQATTMDVSKVMKKGA